MQLTTFTFIYSPKLPVIPRKRWLRPNMTEKLFTGTLKINQQTNQLSHFTDGQKKHHNQSNIPKIYKAELWFLCIKHCLIVLYNCMKFHLNSFNGCQVTEQTRNSIINDQREITPKIYKAELRFLCMTYRLIVLYNCMKFHFNSFNG